MVLPLVNVLNHQSWDVHLIWFLKQAWSRFFDVSQWFAFAFLSSCLILDSWWEQFAGFSAWWVIAVELLVVVVLHVLSRSCHGHACWLAETWDCCAGSTGVLEMSALIGNARAIWDVCWRFSANSTVGWAWWTSVEMNVMLGGLEVNSWDIGVLSRAGLTGDSSAWDNRILEGVEVGVERTRWLLPWVKMHDLILNEHRALMSAIPSTYPLLPQMIFIHKDLRRNWDIRKYGVIVLARELVCSSSKVFIIRLNNHFSWQIILHEYHLSRGVPEDLHPGYSVDICKSKVVLLAQ